MMDLASAMLDAGLGVMFVSILIAGRAIWTRLRASREELLLRNRDDGLRSDLFLSLVWSGMLLMQVGPFLLHADSSGIQNLSTLAIGATSGTIFICGCLAGRLSLRLEMRSKKTHGGPTSAPGP